MAPSPAHLLEAERGHRRGVVLGLTMAEIMLLLLFCLLLVSGALLQDSEERLGEIEKRAALAEARAAEAETRLAELVPVAPVERPQIDLVQLEKDRAELMLLREESARLRELLPPQGIFSQAAPLSEEVWRELVLAQEAGREVIASGLTLQEVQDGIAALTEQRMAKPVPSPEPELPAPSGHDWPPIITLGSDEFRFVTNSAELSEEFRRRLQTDIAGEVRAMLEKFGVDVIEVVGHTDEQPITTTRVSTLDVMAIDALAGNVPIEALVPVDNAGLGLARAIAVANALKAALGDSGVSIIPLSAAQLVLPGDVVSDGQSPDANQDRRRIEIRIRRSDRGAQETSE